MRTILVDVMTSTGSFLGLLCKAYAEPLGQDEQIFLCLIRPCLALILPNFNLLSCGLCPNLVAVCQGLLSISVLSLIVIFATQSQWLKIA